MKFEVEIKKIRYYYYSTKRKKLKMENVSIAMM